MDTKFCSYCSGVYELDQFKSRSSQCKTCYNAYMRDWSRKNKATVNARVLRYYKKNREIKILERKTWYENNKDKHKETMRLWIENNPEKNALINKRKNHVRRAKLKTNGIFRISTKETAKLYRTPCFFCGSADNIQLDHVIPVSRGGRHSIGNIISSCEKCNKSRGKLLITEWRKKF